MSFYFGYYLINYAADPTNVIQAEKATVRDYITSEGYLVRSEQVIEHDGSGVAVLIASEGERVAKGGPVARVYASAADAERQAEIQSITKRIEAINTALDGVTYGTSSLSDIESKISSLSSQIAILTARGNGREIYSLVDELNIMLSRKSMLLASGSERATATSMLESEVRSLKQMSGGSYSTVKAPNTGYFVGTTDGLEYVLTPETMGTLTAQGIKGMSSYMTTSDNNIGKIVTNFTWYYITAAPEERVKDMSVGDSVELGFSYLGENTLPATVFSINADDNGQAVLILECTYMSSELSHLRRQTGTVIKSSVEGIKVSDKAIRVVDGETGVFVLHGGAAKFVPVSILYQGDDYYMVRETEGGITASDMVLIGGKKIYDGKQIR